MSGLGGGGGTDSHTQRPAQRSVTRCHWPYLQRHKKSETHQEKEKPHEFRNIFAPDETYSLQINKTFILCNLKALPSTFPINFVVPVLVKMEQRDARGNVPCRASSPGDVVVAGMRLT